MKYVKADNLIDYCKFWIDVYKDSPDPKDKARRDQLYAVIGEIINSQINISHKYITGEWYNPTGMMPPEFTGRHRCSVCEGFAMHDWKRHREQLTQFCPHCGAMMKNAE